MSYPVLNNDLICQNRAYYIGVGQLGTGTPNQQHVVALFNAFTPSNGPQAPSQSQADAIAANGAGSIVTGGTGACTTASYWDIGVRPDTGPTNHASTVTLNPVYSVLSNTAGYSGTGNSSSNPTVWRARALPTGQPFRSRRIR